MNRLMFRQITAAAVVALVVWSAGCVRPRPKAQPDLGHIFRPARELTGKTPIIIIPGMLRSLMLFGPEGIDERTVSEQIVRLLTRGIVAEGRMLEDAR